MSKTLTIYSENTVKDRREKKALLREQTSLQAPLKDGVVDLSWIHSEMKKTPAMVEGPGASGHGKSYCILIYYVLNDTGKIFISW